MKSGSRSVGEPASQTRGHVACNATGCSIVLTSGPSSEKVGPEHASQRNLGLGDSYELLEQGKQYSDFACNTGEEGCLLGLGGGLDS